MNQCSSFNKRISIIIYVFLAFLLLKYFEDRTCIHLVFDDKFFRRLLRYSRILIILLYFYCEFKNGFNKINVLKSTAFLAIFTVSGYYSQSWSWIMFDLVFIPFLFSNYVSFYKVTKITFYCFSLGTLFIIALYFMKVFPEVSFSRDESIRYSLGFTHPNNLGLFLMIIAMTSVFFVNRFSWLQYSFILLLTVFCVLVPKSYTPAYIMFILLLGLPFIYCFENKEFSEYVKRKLFLWFIIIFTLVVSFIYLISIFRIGEAFISFLPGALWARFELGYRALNEYGFSLVGQTVTLSKPLFESDPNALILDCSYFFMPIVMGILPTAIFFVLYFLSVRHSIFNLNLRLFFIQFLTLFYGVSETMIFSPYFMFVFLGLTSCLAKRTNEE